MVVDGKVRKVLRIEVQGKAPTGRQVPQSELREEAWTLPILGPLVALLVVLAFAVIPAKFRNITNDTSPRPKPPLWTLTRHQ